LVETHDVGVTAQNLLLIVELLDETSVVYTVFAGRGDGDLRRRGLRWMLRRNVGSRIRAFRCDSEAMGQVLGFLGFGNLAISLGSRTAGAVGTIETFNLLGCIGDT